MRCPGWTPAGHRQAGVRGGAGRGGAGQDRAVSGRCLALAHGGHAAGCAAGQSAVCKRRALHHPEPAPRGAPGRLCPERDHRQGACARPTWHMCCFAGQLTSRDAGACCTRLSPAAPVHGPGVSSTSTSSACHWTVTSASVAALRPWQPGSPDVRPLRRTARATSAPTTSLTLRTGSRAAAGCCPPTAWRPTPSAPSLTAGHGPALVAAGVVHARERAALAPIWRAVGDTLQNVPPGLMLGCLTSSLIGCASLAEAALQAARLAGPTHSPCPVVQEGGADAGHHPGGLIHEHGVP